MTADGTRDPEVEKAEQNLRAAVQAFLNGTMSRCELRAVEKEYLRAAENASEHLPAATKLTEALLARAAAALSADRQQITGSHA